MDGQSVEQKDETDHFDDGSHRGASAYAVPAARRLAAQYRFDEVTASSEGWTIDPG